MTRLLLCRPRDTGVIVQNSGAGRKLDCNNMSNENLNNGYCLPTNNVRIYLKLLQFNLL